jgi:hypothetical protein
MLKLTESFLQVNTRYPLVPYLTRGAKWVRGKQPERFNRLSLLIAILLVFAIWLITMIVLGWRTARANRDEVWLVIDVLLVIGYVSAFVLDAACLLLILSKVMAALNNGLWEMMHLANFRADHFIEGHYDAALIRVWPLLIVVMHLRLAVVLWVMVQIMLDWARLPPGGSLLWPILLLFVLSPFVAVYVMEPRSRIQAVAGLALLTATHIRQPSLALLAAALTLAFMWALQLALIALLWTIAYTPMRPREDVPDALCTFPMAYWFVVLVGHTIYWRAREFGLNAAVRRLARYNE